MTLRAPNNFPVSASSLLTCLRAYSSSASACTAGLNPPPQLAIMPKIVNVNAVGAKAMKVKQTTSSPSEKRARPRSKLALCG